LEFGGGYEIQFSLLDITKEASSTRIHYPLMCRHVDIDHSSRIVSPRLECLECASINSSGKFRIASHFVSDAHSHAPVEMLEGGTPAFGDMSEEGSDRTFQRVD
jgi:hypothetical protein